MGIYRSINSTYNDFIDALMYSYEAMERFKKACGPTSVVIHKTGISESDDIIDADFVVKEDGHESQTEKNLLEVKS